MKIELCAWLETEDSLELGPCVGAIWLEDGQVSIAVKDLKLEEDLLQLLEQPLALIISMPSGGTGQKLVSPDDKDYFNALVERLARRDFRLHARLMPK